MPRRKRNVPIYFMVTEQEHEQIKSKMLQYGTKNMGAYLRKMAIDGYVVRLDLADVKEMVSLLRYSSNNLNQYTKRAHQTGRVYLTDIYDLKNSFERLWEMADQIMTRLSRIK
ncbi:MAG: plasmid mobilization relaxosome protein MobC [Clostridiaceae bacterium]|nr:plasmid mobilization relaxosome protein MobC [Clostridiaceae bacterium]